MEKIIKLEEFEQVESADCVVGKSRSVELQQNMEQASVKQEQPEDYNGMGSTEPVNNVDEYNEDTKMFNNKFLRVDVAENILDQDGPFVKQERVDDPFESVHNVKQESDCDSVAWTYGAIKKEEIKMEEEDVSNCIHEEREDIKDEEGEIWEGAEVTSEKFDECLVDSDHFVAVNDIKQESGFDSAASSSEGASSTKRKLDQSTFEIPENEADQPPSKKHRCHLCDYRTSWNHTLQRHIRSVHLKMRTQKCYLCDFSTSRRSTLRRHIDCVHVEVKTYKCNLCAFNTNEKPLLQDHALYVHPNVKQHKCRLCDYFTTRPDHLRRHVDSIHLNIKEYKCLLCDYVAPQKVTLKNHVDVVHLKVQTYRCDSCDYTSTRVDHLKRHVDSIHLLIKDNKCDFCDYSANRSGDLKRHINRVHRPLNTEECDLCGFRTEKGDLETHVEKVHLNRKEFKCPNCDFITGRKSDLAFHINEFHTKDKSQ